MKLGKTIASGLSGLFKTGIGDIGKGMLAGAAGAAVAAANMGRSIKDRAIELKDHIPTIPAPNTKKSREVVEMKKSTLVALLVALAAVAGVLGALYVYVLRREKELDEYEQLLFSEDFNDDLPDDMSAYDDEAEDDTAAEAEKE